MLKELKEELEKALNLMNPNWKKQNNTDDRLTNFIGCIINGVDRINFYQCHFFNKKS